MVFNVQKSVSSLALIVVKAILVADWPVTMYVGTFIFGQ